MDYFVGWDVGAWGCRSSSSSQDSLVALTCQGQEPNLVGSIWRGNLRDALQTNDTLAEIINGKCKVTISATDTITVAIDTPLGFPADTVALLTNSKAMNPTLAPHSENSFVFRRTEMWLAQHRFPPLSAIKDMIGSQSTKGMFLLQKFQLKRPEKECGIWMGSNMTAIECYPTTCKRSEKKGYICHGSKSLQQLYETVMTGHPDVATDDEEDAVYCSLIAFQFASDRDSLVPPQPDTPRSEGWVWYPEDARGRQSKKKQRKSKSKQP